MKANIKKLWVAALRSGKYKQTTTHLRQGDSFCCLGVLCNIHAQHHPDIAAKQKKNQYLGEACMLPPAVAAWAGIQEIDGGDVTIDDVTQCLWQHNDYEHHSFKKIAAAIEAQL